MEQALRKIVTAVVTAAALALGGCGISLRPDEPTAAQLQERSDALNVMPADPKGDIVAYMRTYLNNPSGIRDASMSPPQIRKVGGWDRYVSCVRYNARNSEGRYLGSRTGFVVFRSGRFDQLVEPPAQAKPEESPAAAQVNEMCKDAAYAPFPELQKIQR